MDELLTNNKFVWGLECHANYYYFGYKCTNYDWIVYKSCGNRFTVGYEKEDEIDVENFPHQL